MYWNGRKKNDYFNGIYILWIWFCNWDVNSLHDICWTCSERVHKRKGEESRMKDETYGIIYGTVIGLQICFALLMLGGFIRWIFQ